MVLENVSGNGRESLLKVTAVIVSLNVSLFAVFRHSNRYACCLSSVKAQMFRLKVIHHHIFERRVLKSSIRTITHAISMNQRIRATAATTFISLNILNVRVLLYLLDSFQPQK